MATTTLTRQQVIEAADELRPILESHETVYAVVKHVSRSGMSRVIDFYVIEPNTTGRSHGLRRISHLMAAVNNRTAQGSSRGWTYDRGGVVVKGCGADMGWMLVYQVRLALGLGSELPNQRGGTEYRPGYGFRIEYL